MSNFKKTLKALVTAPFRRKREDAVATYLSRFQTIDTLIEHDLLAVDILKAYVVMDISLYRGYEKVGQKEQPRLAAFFDTLRAYINFQRGIHQIDRLLPPEQRINFAVTMNHMQLFDTETHELILPPQTTVLTLLIGYAVGKEVVSRPYRLSDGPDGAEIVY